MEDKLMIKRRIFLCLMMTFLLSMTSVNAAAKPKDTFQQVTLKNGLKLMYRVMKGEPTVSMCAVIPIGMNYTGKKSIAHLTEHMIFRGSEIYSFSDILNVTSRQGGTFSGFTTFKATTYNFVVPQANFDAAFQVFNSMLWSATLKEHDFTLEQKIVLHEADMNYASRLPGYSVLRYFYPEHSDTPETVYGIAAQDLKDFYQSYYQPANATYIMAGDFQPEAVIAELERLKNVYGESSKKISDSIIKEFELPQGEIVAEKNLYPYHYQVLLGYQFSGLSPADRMVLQILGYLYGSTYRIDYQKNEFQKYYVLNRSVGDRDYFGMYYLERNHPYHEESVQQSKANLLKFIRQFRKVDLKKARKNMAFLVELERIQSERSAAGAVEYELQRLTETENITVDSLAVLNKLSQRDLERVINKYFVQPPTTCVIVKHNPEGGD
jgi:predicted Zn-dependent peptidase